MVEYHGTRPGALRSAVRPPPSPTDPQRARALFGALLGAQRYRATDTFSKRASPASYVPLDLSPFLLNA